MSTFEAESIVSKMINPEAHFVARRARHARPKRRIHFLARAVQHNDLSALGMGAIAPCISAPWWEEVSDLRYTLLVGDLCTCP